MHFSGLDITHHHTDATPSRENLPEFTARLHREWKTGFIEVERPPLYFGEDRPERLKLYLTPPPLLYREFGGVIDALVYQMNKLMEDAIRGIRDAGDNPAARDEPSDLELGGLDVAVVFEDQQVHRGGDSALGGGGTEAGAEASVEGGEPSLMEVSLFPSRLSQAAPTLASRRLRDQSHGPETQASGRGRERRSTSTADEFPSDRPSRPRLLNAA